MVCGVVLVCLLLGGGPLWAWSGSGLGAVDYVFLFECVSDPGCGGWGLVSFFFTPSVVGVCFYL